MANFTAECVAGKQKVPSSSHGFKFRLGGRISKLIFVVFLLLSR